MSNSTGKFVSELSLNIKTVTPITVIHTDDPFESLELIHAAIPAIRHDTDKVYFWSATNKWTDISERDKDISDLVARPVKAEFPRELVATDLGPIFGSPEVIGGRKPIFIVSFITSKFKKDLIALMQELRDFDYIVRNGINQTYRLIILANKSFEMNEDYENLVSFIEHDPPSEPELEEIFNDKFMAFVDGTVSKSFKGNFAQASSSIRDLKDFSLSTLRGLSARQVLITLNKALQKSALRAESKVVGFDLEVFKEYCFECKFKEVNQSKSLTLLKPFSMSQVGGLAALKSWFDERSFAYTPEAIAKRVKRPKGALLVGPPGTGKTLIARAIGERLNRPTVQFDISGVLDRYIGSSEKGMDSALASVDAVGPCVLYVDEIDKVFSGQGGGSELDGGVNTRVLGKLLTWAQDRKTDVFLIMAANRIGNIPPELIRKGRLDQNFFVGFPNADERKEIFDIHLSASGYSVDDLSNVIDGTEGYSAAEVEYIVNESILKAAYRDEEHGETHLLEIAKATKPMSVTHSQDLVAMIEWAKSNAVPASLPVSSQVSTRTPQLIPELEDEF